MLAFWNLNFRTNKDALPERTALLADVGAEVVLVAECDWPTFETLAAAFGSGGHHFGLEGLAPVEILPGLSEGTGA